MPFPRSLSGMMQDRSLLLFCGLAAAAALFLIVSNAGQAFAELSPTQQQHLQDAASAAADHVAQPRTFSRGIGDSVSVASTFDNLGARVPRVFNVGISDGLNIATSPTPPPPSSAATAITTPRPATGLQQGTGRAEEKLGPRNPIESKGDLTNKDQKNGSVQEQPQGSISQEPESILSTLMQDLLGSDDSEPDDSSSSNSHHTVAVQVPPTIYIDSLYGAYAIAVIVISVAKSPRVVSIRRQIVALYAVEPQQQDDKPRDAELPMYARVAIIVVVIVAAVAMVSAAGPVIGEAFAETNAAGTAYRSNTGTNTVNSPKYREWNPATSTWSSEVELPTAGSPIRTIKYIYSPTSAERAVATLSNNGDINLFVCDNSCTTASKWTRIDGDTGTVGTQPIANMGTPTAPYSYFDIAYEQSSDELMIVYDKTTTTDTNDFFYRTYSNEVLSSESGFDYVSDGTSDNDIRYFKMASKPGSDEITMILEDATSQDALAMIWDGSSWGNVKTISSAMGTTSITGEAIGVAYETSSGASVVFAGNGANSAAYARWTGSWPASASTTDPNSSSGNDVKFVSLNSDPASGSNKIMICQLDDLTNLTCRQIDAGSLSGSSWTISGTITVSANTSRRFDFAWAPTGSTGLLVWDDSNNNRISRNTFTSPSTWGATGTTALSGTTAQVWIDSATNPTAADTVDSLWLTLNSNTLGVGSLRYDGSTLTSISTTSHTSAAGSTSYDAIAVDFQKSKVVRRSIAETLTVSPTVTMKVTRTLTNTVTISPAIAAAKSKTASIPQTITITPTIVTKVTRSLLNTLTVSDSVSRSVSVTADSNVAGMAYRSDDGTNGSSSPKYREWNPTTKTWGSQVELESAGSPIRNTWIEFSPVSTKRVIIVLSDDGTLDSYACDFGCTTPGNWVVTHDVVDLWNAVTPDPQKRQFDIEFEHASGDLMLVYDKEDGGDVTTDLFYRIMPDSGYTFGSEHSIDDTTQNPTEAVDTVYSFVRLDSRRTAGSNDLGLVAESETNHYTIAWYFDGATQTFGNQITLTTSTSTDTNYEGVGVGFETSSGNLLAVAADGANIVYSKFSSGSWSAPATLSTLNANTIRWVRFVPNPNAGTNGIQLVVSDQSNQLNSAYWSGSAWTVYSGGTRHDSSIDASTTRVFDFAWDNAGDATRGILLWATNSGQLAYKRYTTPDTWTGNLNFSDDGTTHAWVSLNEHTNPTSADAVSMLGAAIDSSARISQIRWDGSATSAFAWTDDGATTAGNTASESFHVDFGRSPVLKKSPLLTITVADALAAKIRTKVFPESVTIAVSLVAEKGSPADSARFAAVYRSNTGTALLNSPKYKEWDPATQTWSSEVELANTGSPIRDALIRFSPDSSLRVVVSHSADGTLNLFKCDNNCTSAGSWTLVAADFADTGTPDANKPYRPYDILFETTGERLMIVYDKELTEDADFYYRTFDGTALSAETGVNLGGNADAEELRYLHLAAHPTTNEMTLAVLDATNLKSYGVVWNGSAWGNVQTVSSSLSTQNADGDSLDVAYETQSGASTIVSGNGSNSAAYARWNGSTWSTGATNPNPNSSSENVKFVSLKSDPLASSNKIMACQSDDGSSLSCSQFNTGTPGAWTVITSNTGTTAGRAFDFAYNPAGTTGLLVSSSGASGTLDYRTFDGTIFGTVSTLSAAGTHKWVLSASATSATDMVNSMFLKSSSNFDTGAIKSKAGKTPLIGDASLTSDSGNDTYESMHIDFQRSKNVKRASADTIAVTPAIARGLGKHLSDAVTIAPAVSKAVSKHVSDSITVAASVAKNAQRPIATTLAVSDSVRKKVTRSITNTITVGDSIAKKPAKPLSVTLSVADSIAIHRGANRSIADAIAVTPSVSGTYHASRSVSDTVTVSPAVAKVYLASRSAAEALSVSDAVARASAFSRVVADSVSFADAVARQSVAARSAADAMTVSDAIRRTSLASRFLADTLSLADSVNKSVSRSVSDTLAVAATVNKSATRSLSETLSLADAVSPTAIRSLADSVAVTDTVVKSISRSIADTLTVAPSASRGATPAMFDGVAVTASVSTSVSRGISDSVTVISEILQEGIRTADTNITVADAIAPRVSRSLSDALSATDTAKVSVSDTASDSVSVSDVIKTSVSHSVADSVAVSDAVPASGSRSAPETLSVADAVSMSASRSISEALAVSDGTSRAPGSTVTDALAVADVISTNYRYSAAVSDSVAATDSATRTLAASRLAADALAVADATSTPASLAREISDTLTVADATLAGGSISVQVSDSLVVSDAIVRAGSSGPFSDIVALNDAVSIGVSRSIGDALSLADSAVPPAMRAMNDAVAVADQVSAVMGAAVSLADSLGIDSQITNVSMHWNRVFEEGVNLADCTPFSCNQSLHFDEGLSLADGDFFTSPPGRVLPASLALTDSIAVNRPQTFISLGDSVAVSPAIKPLLPILVNSHADDHGRPPNFSIPGNYTWDGTPASLRDAVDLEPLYFNTTVNRDNLPNQVVTLRLWDVNMVPTADLPANNTLISDRAANIPAGVPVQARVNFMDTPSLSGHSNFIQSLDVRFTPAVLTTDFGLIVTPMDSPPAGAGVPPEELRPLYIDVRWWGNVPGGSDPSVQSYYEHPPTFTFTVTDDWARSESAVGDANGVPLIKLRLLNETTHQWEEISAVQRPTSGNDGTYTFTATLPHFSDYVITAVKSATAGPGSSSSSSHVPPVQPKTFAVGLADSLTLAESSSSKAVSVIEEFANEKFSADLLDSVVISSKPVAYNTFKILQDVKVAITVVDVEQDGVAPPSATAVLQVDITNAGDEAEKFMLNFWYNDQTGKRAFDLSQQVEVGAHGSKSLQVTIPFTEPGTYRVTAEARSLPDNDLLESTQLMVIVPWLSVYLYVLIAVAIAILGGSAIAIALYMARNGMMIAVGAGAAGAILLLLLGKKDKPRVRVAEKGSAGNDNYGDDDDDNYDLLVNVKLANGSEGRLVHGERMASFDFEIINKSRRKQEFVLAYHLVDMAGTAMPESAAEVKIPKRKTQMRNAKIELLAGAYILHVEARSSKGDVLSSDRVSVRTG